MLDGFLARFWVPKTPRLGQFTFILVWAVAGLIVMAWAFTLVSPKTQRIVFSDQATHIMIAASVWHDRDLKYSLRDLARFKTDYPNGNGPAGLFLKQGTTGELFYAKPYIYGAIAAPFYAAFGLNGFIILNVFCLVFIGAVAGLAMSGVFGFAGGLLTSLVFVLPSAFLPWVFVAHPDLFIAALLSGGCYLLLQCETSRILQIIGAALLGAALHEKIPFLVVIPFVILAMSAVSIRRRALFAAVVALSWFLFSTVNIAIDGSLLAYQGLRLFAHGAPYPLELGWKPPTRGITDHVFDPIAVALAIFGNLSLFPDKIIDFFVGRQTGIIPYFAIAFGLLILRLAFVWGRAALLLVGFFSYLLMQWLVFPTNGYGGAGSYGPRYMMQALPLIPLAFLGSKTRTYCANAFTSRGIAIYILFSLVVISSLIQHKIFFQGHEAVMRYSLANITPPLNLFRLEKWLLPTTLEGETAKYIEVAKKGSFQIFKPDEMNRGAWLGFSDFPKESEFFLYKEDSGESFPHVELRVSVSSKVQILSAGRVVWSGLISDSQPQTIDVDGLVHFNTAFDLLTNKQIALGDFVVVQEVEMSKSRDQPAAVMLQFNTIPLPFTAIGKRLTPAQLVAHGADLRTGWSHLESWGIWSDGGSAHIALRVDEGTKFKVEMSVHAFVPPRRDTLLVEFRCSGGSTNRVLFERGKVMLINLHCEKPLHHQYLVVTASIPSPTSPLVEGQGVDDRNLGVGLRSFKIELVE